MKGSGRLGWNMIADIPFDTRSAPVVDIGGGEFLVAGGRQSNYLAETSAVYNPDDDKWTTVSNFPFTRSEGAGNTNTANSMLTTHCLKCTV